MILSVSDPVWNKSTRNWVLTYKVKDKLIGEYDQHVFTEALISAEMMRYLIVERMAKQKVVR